MGGVPPRRGSALVHFFTGGGINDPCVKKMLSHAIDAAKYHRILL